MTGEIRDQRADRQYFDEVIELNSQAVATGRKDAADEDLRQGDVELYVNLLSIYRNSALRLTDASYSIGDPPEKMAEYATEAIAAETLFRTYQPQTKQGSYDFAAHPAQYVRPLQLLSIAILLDIRTGVDELVQQTGSRGMDAIYEFLVDPDHDPAKVGDELAWPKPYKPLLEAIRNEAARPKQLKTFLTRWYNGSRRSILWGSHLNIASGDHSYSGYWCYEAAAVTKVLQIDDSSYRDNEYYPRDLLTDGKDH